ncbi:hypothetical protein HNR46_003646 [Haloferula luteola]|uniref:Uncharacterized protein n=1 Tax=Haloferula luteola TaxID=595692 RepID=A0A840VHW6_9BACT|nr:hypothetical protein [Haloferula luteola]MBB5353389.1 hypothetical protein [Haloferula luteola]
MIFRILVLVLAMAKLASAQAVLEPPLGMKWGDRPERLIAWADERKLDVSIDLPAASPHLRVIRLRRDKGTIPGVEASSIEARYEDGRLIEITVTRGGEGTDAESLEAAFHTERKRLAAEHGPLTANHQEKSVSNQFSTVTTSYHREPVRGLFLLIAFTRIEDLLRHQSEAELSILYRNENLRNLIVNDRAQDTSPDSR